MSIGRLRELRDEWRAQSGLQKAIETAFEKIAFDQDYLKGCENALATGAAPRKVKYIKDNLWGMMEFDWRAMRLLDCPVVQRLRGVKQLGFTYLTYPSAEHSRFAHSLGVACVVGRFLDAIERRHRDHEDGEVLRFVGPDSLRPLTRDDIVHAALLHDVGHMPFSHATEAILTGREGLFTCGPSAIREILGDAQVILGKNIQLSEMMSLLFILSPRFEAFYNGYVNFGQEDPDALLRVACLIAGLPPDPRLGGVTDIISSASVDADKIDYINRDAKACGIPVGVDVSRVFLRSGLIEASREHLRGLKEEPRETEVLFIVNASGMDTLDEITRARAGLYQRVYLHAVTRAAEAVLSKTLEANAHGDAPIPELTDAIGLWAISDSALLARVVVAENPAVRKLGRNLANRWLPKKACVFNPVVAKMMMPLASVLPRLRPENEKSVRRQVVNTPLEKLRHKAVIAGIGSDYERQIREEADRICGLLPDDLRPKTPLGVLVVVGSAYIDKPQTDCIVLQNGDLLRTSDFTNSREQSDAFDIFKAVGYVMCDAEWRIVVMIAARSVLCRVTETPMLFELRSRASEADAPRASDTPDWRDEVHLVQRMILDWDQVVRRTGIKRGHLDPVVSAVTKRGYFDDKPTLAYEEDADGSAVIRIAERLGKYEGQRSWGVKAASVAAFLNQFPPRLRGSMKEMLLGKFVLFDTEEISVSMLPKLRKMGEAQVVALSPNSGQAIRTILEREAKSLAEYRGLSFAKDIEEALRGDADTPIALVDDNISSATQARAQFLAWTGVPRADWPEECRGEDGILDRALDPQLLNRLYERGFRIVVGAARDVAQSNLEALFGELGIPNFQGVHFEHPITGLTWDPELRDHLSRVGKSLMAWATYRKSVDELSPSEADYCERRAFGYGNAGALIATTSNVPTGTVTPIWLPGLVDGQPWMPLMIRQNKLRHLVIG